MSISLSVVIPVGPGRTAQNALRSLLDQSHRGNWEVILVGDGFKPDVAEFLYLPLKVTETPRPGGANVARNFGASQASGEIICFLDDDDAYQPLVLGEIYKQVVDEPSVSAWSLGANVRVGEKSYFSSRRKVLREADIWRRNRAGGCSSMVVRKSAFKAAGCFDERMIAMQDWDLWLRLSRIGVIRGINMAWITYNAHDGPRISTNPTARRAGLECLLRKNRAFWPKRVQAFHECRLAAMDYQEGRCSVLSILCWRAPCASVYFIAKALAVKQDVIN